MSSAGFSEMLAPSANRLQAEIVCRCLDVTDVEILASIETLGAESVKEVGRCTGAGQGCTVCHRTIRTLLENR